MRHHITAHDIANDIRMTRSQFTGTFLVVEGQTSDLRVYKRLIDSEVAQIIPAHNKENALQVLSILENANFAGVVVVVDADFWRLNEQEPHSPHLFLTDTHDLETMIIKSPALEKLLDEFGSPQKISEFINQHNQDIRSVLLEIGRSIGYLRWVSELRGYSLKFEGVVFSRFIEDRSLNLDVSALIRTVKHKSGRHDIDDENLKREIDDVSNPNHDLWDVCCGHDLVCILSLGLGKVLGSNRSNDVKPEVLEKFLRVGYEATYFFTTELYKSLKNWENTNTPFRLFPAP